MLVSCSGLKGSWKNFRAHYNTFYNAEKSFKAGLKEVEDRQREVNPEKPTRVHAEPPGAGQNHFENTIEKGARILRKFPDSKWTDDALLLMGKSYYFNGEYFPAIEKFEELEQLSDHTGFRQEALIWKARSLLDLGQFEEGISFITNNLNQSYWEDAKKAEFKVLLAQHHSLQQNFEEAADYLGEAMADLEETKLKGRTFFLYGQILENLERFGEAYFAYDNVASRFPEYDYIYWSRMKKAEVARKEGNIQQALSIYTAMSKDDKNVSRLDRINYEIARTLEMRGDIQQAEKGYKEIIYGVKSSATGNVRAKTYYRLGRIYSEEYDDFTTAAAYFDTSSTQIGNIEFLESKFDAQRLASVYGQYSDLKAEVTRLDSLLWLGSLSPSRLDSALQKVREQKRRALREQDQKMDEGDNRLTNISGAEETGNGSMDASLYGFLNYKNPRLKEESMRQFAAVWGNRPLVDNWRRMEVVRSTGIAEEIPETSPEQQKQAVLNEEDTDAQLNIDISEIPTTTRQKQEYHTELANTKYQLGNLFFFSLNMADSARTYFTDIIHNYPESSLVPQSMYSLFEIYSEAGNRQQYLYWGNRILNSYPDTRYAEIVSRRLGKPDAPAEKGSKKESEKLSEEYRSIEESADTVSAVKAERFRSLALANQGSKLAPLIHYRAIETYVDLAKSKTDTSLYRRFLEARAEAQADSISADSLVSGSSPFFGSYWDRVRKLISEHDSLYSGRSMDNELKILKEYLSMEAAPPKRKTEQELREPDSETPIRSCSDLESSVDIVGGMANFLSRVNLPEELLSKSRSEEITFRMLISETGKVKSAELVSSDALPEIRKAFGEAIQNFLYFDPVMVGGQPEEVLCELSFPLKPSPEPVSEVRSPKPDKKPMPCSELFPELDIVGGMKNFLAGVNGPENLRDKELPGELTFEITIGMDGKVTVLRNLDTEAPPALIKAFEEAINKRLYFDPYSLNSSVRTQSCSMTFPLGD